MKNTLRILCLLIAGCLIFAGCSLQQPPAEALATPSAAPEEPAAPAENPVVCTVEGREITMNDFMSIFSYYYQQLYSFADFSNEETLFGLQDNVLDALIQNEVLYLQAQTQGFTLDAADQKTLEETYNAQFESMMSTYRESAKNMNEADVEGYAKKLLGIDLAAAGYGTVDEYFAKLKTDIEKSILVSKLQKSVYDTVTVTDAEVKAQYEDGLAADTAAYQENPAGFESAQGAFEAGGGPLPLYVPEGYRRVKHILIKSAEGVDAEGKAKELYGKLVADPSTFDALLEEFGEDGGMKAEPNKTLGYLTSKDTNFVPEFKEAALALENAGDISAPVKSDFGYHIIKLVELIPSGPRTFEEAKESLTQTTLTARQRDAFEAALADWVAEAEINRHTELVREIGKVEAPEDVPEVSPDPQTTPAG